MKSIKLSCAKGDTKNVKLSEEMMNWIRFTILVYSIPIR